MKAALLSLAVLSLSIFAVASTRLNLDGILNQDWSPDPPVDIVHYNYSQGLAVKRQRLAAASYRGKVYFGGGTNNAGDLVDIYDVEAKEWSTAKLLAPRSALTATAAGGKVLFAGGKPAYRGVDIYDVETGLVTGATLSSGRQLLAATSVMDRWALFAGGEGIRKKSRRRSRRRRRHHRGLLSETGIELDEDEVDMWDDMNGLDDDDLCGFYDDCDDDEFEEEYHCINEADYQAGGASLCHKTPEPGKQVDIYDSLTGTWTSGPWLSESRRKLAAASVGEIAAFGGGWNLKHRLSSAVDIWNSTSGLWSRAKLSTPRMYLAAASAGSQILFGGGFHFQQISKRKKKGTGSDVVDLYDTATGKWTVAHMSFHQYNLAGASVAGRWAVFAGAQMPKVPVINMYDSVTGNWTMLEPMSVRSACLAGTGVELSSSKREGSGPGSAGCAVFGGGEARPGGITAAVDVYCFSAEDGKQSAVL